jgi:hypothetical protein
VSRLLRCIADRETKNLFEPIKDLLPASGWKWKCRDVMLFKDTAWPRPARQNGGLSWLQALEVYPERVNLTRNSSSDEVSAFRSGVSPVPSRVC